jgi:hypothetical protein
MRAKKKKTKKEVKVDDLKPSKDPKSGMPQSPPHDLNWILQHLEIGVSPGAVAVTKPNSPL